MEDRHYYYMSSVYVFISSLRILYVIYPSDFDQNGILLISVSLSNYVLFIQFYNDSLKKSLIPQPIFHYLLLILTTRLKESLFYTLMSLIYLPRDHYIHFKLLRKISGNKDLHRSHKSCTTIIKQEKRRNWKVSSNYT